MGSKVMEVLERHKGQPEVRAALMEIRVELEVEKHELSKQLKKVRNRRGEIGAELRLIEKLLGEAVECDCNQESGE